MSQFEAKESSNVGWARYDEATHVLEIDFKDKAGNKASTYAYDEFPPAQWQAFMEAPSKGRHFAFAIRPNFRGRRL